MRQVLILIFVGSTVCMVAVAVGCGSYPLTETSDPTDDAMAGIGNKAENKDGASGGDLQATEDSGVINEAAVAARCLVGGGKGAWTRVESGIKVGLRGVWSSGCDDVYVSGDNGIWRSTDSGTTWRLDYDAAGARGPTLALWGSGPGDVYAGGFEGIIHSRHGGPWTTERSSFGAGGGYPIMAIWGSAADDIYAGSWKGGLYHSHGNGHWKGVFPPNPDVAVTHIWGSSGMDVYAGPSCSHTSGDDKWSHDAACVTWGSSASDLYLLTPVFRSTGTSTIETTDIFHSANGAPGDAELHAPTVLADLDGSSECNIFAVGGGGLIFHSSGSGSWAQESNADTHDLAAVWAGGCGAYAVGAGGTILRRQ